MEVVEEEESDDADVVDVVGHGLEDSFDGELALPALGGTGGLPGLGKKQEGEREGEILGRTGVGQPLASLVGCMGRRDGAHACGCDG